MVTRHVARQRVEPVPGPFAVTLHLPGSKSIANRALVCAALASGRTTLANVPDGDDTIAMIDALKRLGIGVQVAERAATIDGAGGHLAPGPLTLDAHLAGTTSRFLTAVAVLGPGPYLIDGAPSLRARPMAPLHDALATLGARVTPRGEAGHLPVEIERAGAHGGALALRGDVSSQFLTALMLVGPLLTGGLEVRLTTPLVSRPYVELTAAVMRDFGIDRVELDGDRVLVPPGAYHAATLTIEPDASSAAYFAAAAATGPPGTTVRLAGLGGDSAQADARFLDVLASMGAEVDRSGTVTAVRRGTSLRGVDVDLAACSDAVPTLGVVAALADGPTRIRGVGFVRAKESDRIGALATELRRCGALVDEHADGLTIHPAELHGATVRTYDDHRMAMAFGVLGLTVPGIVVEDPAVVAKSFPGFWDALAVLRRAVGSTSR